MSIENVEKFFARVRDDRYLQGRIRAIDYHDQDTAETALVALASEQGLKFSGDDYRAAVKRRVQARHAATRKGCGDLESAAGGRFRSETDSGETCIVTDNCDYCHTHGADCHWTEWPGCWPDG